MGGATARMGMAVEYLQPPWKPSNGRKRKHLDRCRSRRTASLLEETADIAAPELYELDRLAAPATPLTPPPPAENDGVEAEVDEGGTSVLWWNPLILPS